MVATGGPIVIVVFVVDHCPHCRALLTDLQRRRVPYRAIDVGREKERLAELERWTWRRQLPVVIDHERCSVGFQGGASSWEELGL